MHRVEVMNAVRRSPKEYATPPVRRGAENGKFVPDVTLDCVACGGTFTRKPHRVGGPEFRGRYCSAQCRDIYRRDHEAGPASPYWVGGAKTYRGRDWKRIRLLVVREQEGTCAHCGLFVGDSLPVNHIRPFRWFATAEEANQRENLVGLCQPCHMRAEPRRRRHADTSSPNKSS
jgi:5-methylcytosine-specific restriction endonuclease McrA